MKDVIVFDTTLRDGEQCPGAAMTMDQKIQVAEILDLMQVDFIEAGFAATSLGDLNAIKKISQTVKYSSVCSLSRAVESDIDAAYMAIKDAKRFRIHTFIATSDIHLQYKLKKTRQNVLGLIEKSVAYARNLSEDVEWSAEDATRSNFEFLCQCIDVAIKNGAKTINIPDTVGYMLPHEYYRLIKSIKNTVTNIDKAILSCHCQNDLGLATANSLAGLMSGAEQVECTINGLGERAGNAALEEVVMAMKTRQNELNLKCNIKTEYIAEASKLIADITGFVVQKNKAIVGENAFSHASGIHQDGVLKNRETYEIMNPKDIGIIVDPISLGKHSGRSALISKLNKLNIKYNSHSIDEIFIKFKELADVKKTISDEDLKTICAINEEI